MAQPIQQRSPRAIDGQQIALERTTSGALLWTMHLADTHPLLLEAIHQLIQASWPERSTEIAGVLVQQTVRHEDYPLAPLIFQSFEK